MPEIATPTAEFLRTYDVPGPRYTSYPPAPHFRAGWDQREILDLFARSNSTGDRNLSFYVHVPFCPKQCLYCGCTTEIGKGGTEILSYFGAVHREMDRLLPLLDPSRPVTQIHFGGGTPNAVPVRELASCIEHLLRGRALSPHAEVAIECDPNLLSMGRLGELRQAGFNRVSFGLQDFDRDVLASVGRGFPRIAPAELVAESHRLGFRGVNLDLIYGLPGQTPDGFAKSVERTVEAAPDRVAVFGYAHVPWAKEHQKALEAKGLPDAESRIEMAVRSYRDFQAAGYVPIGMDHYARPDDELSLALREGTLHRNFQGYCSRRSTGQVVAFGASGISQLHEGYVQSIKESRAYSQAVARGELPLERAYVLSPDERFHRDVINSIMCRGELDLDRIGEGEGVSPAETRRILSPGLDRLDGPVADGLCTFDGAVLRTTPLGRLAVRNIAFLFDPLLKDSPGRYSRTV